MSNIKVGLGQVDYTPELGLPLMGNYRDDYAARGVHDPLFAKAMVFADTAGTKVALLSMDVCMLDRDNVSLMRRAIASKCDIAAENIFIAATHTHSGPAPTRLGALPKADDASIEAFLEKAATAVVLANENIKDSKLFVGRGSEERTIFNRRLKCKDGETHMAWEDLDSDFVIEPLGPVDPQIMTLSVEQEDVSKAAIVNFGEHPAILAGDNWLYSADYPGYLAEAMSGILDDDFMTLFFNGCCGNVVHLDYSDPTQGRGYQMTQRVGYMLAVAAYKAMKNQQDVLGDKIIVHSEKVALPRVQISDEQVKWCKEVLEKAKTEPTQGQVDGLPDEHYAETWMMMHEKQGADDEVEIMTIRIGDVGIVGLPAEVFCEFGMEIKKKSAAKHTFVIELANDAIGYLPTKAAFGQGGYEPKTGSTMYEQGAGEKITAAAINQLNKLFKE